MLIKPRYLELASGKIALHKIFYIFSQVPRNLSILPSSLLVLTKKILFLVEKTGLECAG